MFTVNNKQTLSLVFLLLNLNKKMLAGLSLNYDSIYCNKDIF